MLGDISPDLRTENLGENVKIGNFFSKNIIGRLKNPVDNVFLLPVTTSPGIGQGSGWIEECQ